VVAESDDEVALWEELHDLPPATRADGSPDPDGELVVLPFGQEPVVRIEPNEFEGGDAP